MRIWLTYPWLWTRFSMYTFTWQKMAKVILFQNTIQLIVASADNVEESEASDKNNLGLLQTEYMPILAKLRCKQNTNRHTREAFRFSFLSPSSWKIYGIVGVLRSRKKVLDHSRWIFHPCIGCEMKYMSLHSRVLFFILLYWSFFHCAIFMRCFVGYVSSHLWMN